MQLKTSRPNLYDYMKVLAIVTMIIDHVGYFFLPGVYWLRAIGRLAFPLFLFLVGFNGSYKRKWSLWMMIIIVEVFMIILRSGGYYSGPILGILAGIGVVRIVLDVYKPYHRLVFVPFILLGLSLLLPLLSQYFDYGSMVMIYAFVGFLLRYQKSWGLKILLVVYAGLFHLLYQQHTFGFSTGLYGAVIVGLIINSVLFLLLSKKNRSLRMGGWWDKVIVWTSRYALWLYVIHFVLFGIIFVVVRG